MTVTDNNENYTGGCLKELFRNIHSIEELLEQFIHLGKALSEISVNAAIASGHVESQSKVFSEIARQIGASSTMIAQLSERSKKLTSQMSTHVLSCIISSTQKEHFLSSLKRIEDEKNSLTVKKVCGKLSVEILNRLHEAQRSLSHLKPAHDYLKQVINRLSSIIVSLRVIANTADNGEGSFFLSIAESIEETSMRATNGGILLYQYISKINTLLTERFACMKGESDAA